MSQSDKVNGGARPPQSKVLHTVNFVKPVMSNIAAKELGESP
jgi:hypothetical protein